MNLLANWLNCCQYIVEYSAILNRLIAFSYNWLNFHQISGIGVDRSVALNINNYNCQP
jgi:hypothetical protein